MIVVVAVPTEFAWEADAFMQRSVVLATGPDLIYRGYRTTRPVTNTFIDPVSGDPFWI